MRDSPLYCRLMLSRAAIYMALPQLPDDIIRKNILIRLEVKSLVRFRSVCKLWNSIICETDFVKDHLYCTSQNPNDDNLIITKGVHERDHSGKNKVEFGYLAILTSSDLSETSDLMHVPHSKYGRAEIDMVGSINGLVCLFHYNLHQFIIWNPAIRQAMKINSSPRQTMVVKTIFGFCWDAMENDFKVVIAYYPPHYSSLSLYVYSCNLGTWSSRRGSKYFDVLWVMNEIPSAIVMGVPYWSYSPYPLGTQRLVKFDVESKDFRVLPQLYASEDHYVLLVNLKDRLSALVYGGHSYDSTVDVYYFDERRGVWSMMYKVGPITGDVLNWRKMNTGLLKVCGAPVFSESVLSCFEYSGEIVFSTSTCYRCYNHKTKKVKDLQNQKGYIRQCSSYMASLIFLEGMKPQHQVEPTLWN